MSFREEATVLTSWKDIARYMGKGVRTVQRWEQELGLPVRRPTGAQHKSAVVVNCHDLDAWLASRFSPRRSLENLKRAEDTPSLSHRAMLKERIRIARELQAANQALARQLHESIRLLTERCNLLAAETLSFGLNRANCTVTDTMNEDTFSESKRIA